MTPAPFQYMPARAWADVPLWLLGMWLLFGLPTLGIGATTGYFNVWDDHHYWANRAPEKQEWYEIFTVFGWPGDAMANSYGGDWQADEAWDYRSDIVTWNALFWTSIGIGGIFVVRSARRLKSLRDGLACGTVDISTAVM